MATPLNPSRKEEIRARKEWQRLNRVETLKVKQSLKKLEHEQKQYFKKLKAQERKMKRK